MDDYFLRFGVCLERYWIALFNAALASILVESSKGSDVSVARSKSGSSVQHIPTASQPFCRIRSTTSSMYECASGVILLYTNSSKMNLSMRYRSRLVGRRYSTPASPNLVEYTWLSIRSLVPNKATR